ncbi:hypothetical protein MMC07_009463 [Pseudocyphellaria aurata]|nr:hypothetical protein [Pseudocyphellaria aurata]
MSSEAQAEHYDLPSHQQTVTIQSPSRTPPSSPRKKAVRITQGQKQALIDNLQLEGDTNSSYAFLKKATDYASVTERARKLRAQYALQAQSLRTRIELRINRIPKSLRSANMGELVAKHLEKTKEIDNSGPPASESTNLASKQPKEERPLPIPNTTKPASTARLRGTKRKSDEMEDADKENAVSHVEPLPNPKKRTKPATIAGTRQATNPSTVLSPKSSNSRTLPHSPLRPPLGSPQKSYISRPVSPLKPMAPLKSASPAKASAITATANLTSITNDRVKSTRSKTNAGRKATNPPATKPAASIPKRGILILKVPTESRSVSSSSNTTTTSTGTTIMKKGRKLNTAVTTVASKKKNPHVGIRAAGKKVAAASVEAPPMERRVLRKRA